MNDTPAKLGWQWVKQGFAMLRQQPSGLSTLFFGYMLLTTLLIVLPLIGPVAHTVLMPLFAIGFMTAAREIQAQRPVLPSLLVAGFRSPAVKKLCLLGLVHLLAFFTAIGIGMMFANFDVLSKLTAAELQANPRLLQDANLIPAILTGAVIYIPALLVISFAAPLVHWQGMGPGKALFYSFFAIKRTAGAFFVFAASLFAITFVTLQLLGAILGIGAVGFAVMRMVSVLLYGLAHCSLYLAYVHIFRPSETDQEVPGNS